MPRERHRIAVYGLAALVCGALTVRAVVRGSDLFQAVLLAAATAYLLGAAAPAVHDRVPHYERVAAIPLGLLGVVAAAVGVPTDLPVLFILLGAAAVVDLRWDPTGNVHGADD